MSAFCRTRKDSYKYIVGNLNMQLLIGLSVFGGNVACVWEDQTSCNVFAGEIVEDRKGGKWG